MCYNTTINLTKYKIMTNLKKIEEVTKKLYEMSFDLNEYDKIGKEKPKTFTFISVIKEMINNIQFTTKYNNDKILVLTNIEIVIILDVVFKINKKNISFVTNEKLVGEYALKYGILPENLFIRTNENYEDFLNGDLMKNNKFDVVIDNPPYNGTLHLDFLKKAYELSNKYVALIHPSSWLYVQTKGSTLTYANKIKNLVGNHFKEFKIFNGNKLFQILNWCPCVVTYIDKTLTSPEVKLIHDINKTEIKYKNSYDINPFFANNDLCQSIKEKILNI